MPSVKVCNVSDVPKNEMKIFPVNGMNVVVYNVEGQFYCTGNVCAHKQGPIGEGYLDPDAKSVTCPLHGWMYDITSGKSLGLPGSIGSFPVKVENNQVMAQLP